MLLVCHIACAKDPRPELPLKVGFASQLVLKQESIHALAALPMNDMRNAMDGWSILRAGGRSVDGLSRRRWRRVCDRFASLLAGAVGR